jgi:vacuolar-type H+-ATPase subunit D/Vma8
MKKKDLLITEYRALNQAYEYSQDNLQAAKDGAQAQANLQNKTLVIVRVVEIITPQADDQAKKNQP